MHFYKADKTINDVLLKNLTFQTWQTNWDGGSMKLFNGGVGNKIEEIIFHMKHETHVTTNLSAE